MSVKMARLAECDADYAESLLAWALQEKLDYEYLLSLTVDEFLDLCANKLDGLTEALSKCLKKQ